MEDNKELAVIQKSIEIFKTAPDVLKKNQERTKKALAVGNAILDRFNSAWAISNEDERISALIIADEKANTYLVNCGNALKEEKEVRAAITQMMDEFKKMFTSAENEIDKSKEGTVPDRVQKNRNKYAQVTFEISERKRIEAERVTAKNSESINIKSAIENGINNTLLDLLGQKKIAVTNAFNAITLDDYSTRFEVLKKMVTNADLQVLKTKCVEKPLSVSFSYHKTDEIEALKQSVFSDFPFANWHDDVWVTQMQVLKDDLLEKMPSKKAELDEAKKLADEIAAEKEKARLDNEKRIAEIEKAKGEEKKRLEEQAYVERKKENERQAKLKADAEQAAIDKKNREEEEQKKQQEELEKNKKAAELATEMKAQGEQTMNLFSQVAATSEIETPNSKQVYEITLLHNAGAVQIFQLWFERFGKDLPSDKLINTKIEQMINWCEKLADKTEEKIESKFIKYSKIFKAKNVK